MLSGDRTVTKAESDQMREVMGSLSPVEADLVAYVVSTQMITSTQRDSLAELCGCAAQITK